jgi:N-methylhydantoinase A
VNGTEGALRLIGVDVGGTFTDVVAVQGNRIRAMKVPTDPQASERSVLAGVAELDVGHTDIFNLSTTAGLNAVITRRLPKVAFLTTMGHRDILDRGRLWRPLESLTDPSWRRQFSDAARPLVPRYLRRRIRERMKADGEVLVALDEAQARAELAVLRDCEIEGVAICLLHSYLNPAHERKLRELVLQELGEIPCSISSEVCPISKEYSRASTTVVDLLMKMKYTEYTARLQSGLSELGFRGAFNYADCSAMLMPHTYAMAKPHRLVVGGPAGGTVASAHFGSFIGKPNLLCADVGGTSCDISVVRDGRPWVNDAFELEWDLLVSTLSTDIVTLGAGGGSIIAVGNGGEIRVGPDSAGADPGPACYGKGGLAPTLTDAALLIGILAPDRFLGGKMPLDESLARAAFERLDTPLSVPERVRQAWLIGLHNIAEGIFDITIRQGLDPRDFSLVAFGAAGPMILPGLLDMLPIESVIVPPNPGSFSALGLVSSDQVLSESRTLYGVLDEGRVQDINGLYKQLESELLPQVDPGQSVRVVRTFDARLLGQGFETPFIPAPAGELNAAHIADMIAAFHQEYERRNGNRFERMRVEGVNYRVQVIIQTPKVAFAQLPARLGGRPETRPISLRHLQASPQEAMLYERGDLLAGDEIPGPAIVSEPMSTTFVPAGTRGRVEPHGAIVISH